MTTFDHKAASTDAVRDVIWLAGVCGDLVQKPNAERLHRVAYSVRTGEGWAALARDLFPRILGAHEEIRDLDPTTEPDDGVTEEALDEAADLLGAGDKGLKALTVTELLDQQTLDTILGSASHRLRVWQMWAVDQIVAGVGRPDDQYIYYPSDESDKENAVFRLPPRSGSERPKLEFLHHDELTSQARHQVVLKLGLHDPRVRSAWLETAAGPSGTTFRLSGGMLNGAEVRYYPQEGRLVLYLPDDKRGPRDARNYVLHFVKE